MFYILFLLIFNLKKILINYGFILVFFINFRGVIFFFMFIVSIIYNCNDINGDFFFKRF